MTLTIGREEVECESFRVRGSYNSTIARLFALPVAVQSTEPLTLEVTIKGNKFKPVKKVRRVYWQKKYVGYFVIGNVSQEWDGDRYRTRLELKECERSDVPQDEIPVYKWRHDLIALSQNLEQTDGAIIAAGRKINPIAESWKVGNTEIASASDDNISPAVLPVSLGGTGASDPVIALINLGAISSASKGLPFGVAPLGADGKVSAIFLPSGSGGGGGNVTFPITVAQGGTNALDAATARTNLGVPSLTQLANYLLIADLPAYPTLASLGGASISQLNNYLLIANLPAYPTLASLGAVSTSTYTDGLALKLDASARSAANGVAPLNVNSLVPTANLPAYPTLASLGAVSTSTYTAGLALKLDASARSTANGVAPLDVNSFVPIANLPLNNFFPFTAGASFRAGSSPANTPSITQAGVDANGLPRYWLVNSVAPVNSRIKSITVANNGNVQIRHHNDDLSDGNVLEHTASGNVLTNGTMRPGSGATAFTGATFVPGALYFRSDLTIPNVLVGSTASTVVNSTGDLTYSDGERWRRISNNVDATVSAKVILSGTLPGSIAANTYTTFGTLNNAGLNFIESVWIVSVYFQVSDASNQNFGNWQHHGAGILANILWKFAGSQSPTTFKIEDYAGNDYNCSVRLNTAVGNRVVQLAFDKALTFAGGANSYYRITFIRLL